MFTAGDVAQRVEFAVDAVSDLIDDDGMYKDDRGVVCLYNLGSHSKDKKLSDIVYLTVNTLSLLAMHKRGVDFMYEDMLLSIETLVDDLKKHIVQ